MRKNRSLYRAQSVQLPLSLSLSFQYKRPPASIKRPREPRKSRLTERAPATNARRPVYSSPIPIYTAGILAREEKNNELLLDCTDAAAFPSRRR